MAAGTTLSRATGVLRTVALAWAIGVTALGDAYNTANTAPNMIFQLAAGGVLSSALVPMLVRQDDPRRRAEVVSILLTLTLVIGVIVSVTLAIGAPGIMRVLTLGARRRPDYEQFLDVGTSWLRMFAPQVALYAASVFAVGVMQSRGRLRLAGFAPVVTNVVTIAAAIVFVRAAGGSVPLVGEMDLALLSILGWGTTLAVAAMAGLHLWGAARTEPGLRLVLRPRDPIVTEVARLGGWVVLYVVINQVGYALVVVMANTVAGGLTAYQWAFTVMQLPYAIVAVSVYAAAAPGLARAAAAGADVSARVGSAAQATCALIVPAALGLAVLSDRLATSLVGADGADLVAAGIVGFAASLVPFALFQLLVRTCYAYQDARTPARVNVTVNVVNVAAALVVVATASSPRARVTGLALSHAASYLAGTVVLGRRLRRERALGLAMMRSGASKVVAATALMTAVLAPAAALAPHTSTRIATVAVSALLAAGGASVYLIAARALGVAAPGLSSVSGRGTPA